MYRCLAILCFFGSGAGSIYLFYQIPSLPFLLGMTEESLRSVISIAWVMIFPVWFALFFAAMALVESIIRLLES